MTSNHQLMKNTPLIYKCIPNYSNCVLPITLYIYKQDTLCSLFFANRSSTGTSSYEAFYHLLSNSRFFGLYLHIVVCPPNNHFGGCILYDEEENVNLARPRFKIFV